MKLVITKGRTQNSAGKEWSRTIYSIESEIEADMLEIERKRLEALIDMWLGTPDNSEQTVQPKQSRRGYCKSCGKKIDPKYWYCYDCNLKRRQS